jgi:hypothetical protein
MNKSLIDNQKELLELINDCLKPKDVEKKQFGEVFTPMTLINEMLDLIRFFSSDNDPKIIKDGIKQYYLVNNKLYKVKKDKSQGELFGNYIDGKIAEGINNNDDDIISKISKKKTSTMDTKIEKIIDDEL